MDASTDGSIRATARALLRRAWLESRVDAQDHAAIRRFILENPYQLAKRLGYSVMVVRSDYFSVGNDIRTFAANEVAFVDTASRKIIVRETKPEIQRISLLHELGHVVLEHDKCRDSPEILFRSVGKATSKSEREAEVFAVEMATPAKYVREIFQRTIGSPLVCDGSDARVPAIAAYLGVKLNNQQSVRFVSALASRAETLNGVTRFQSLLSRFGVSESLMARRLPELGLVISSVTKHHGPSGSEAKAERAKLIVFCSTERLEIAEAIRRSLCREMIVTLWSDDQVFQAGKTPLENVQRAIDENDFVLALLGPDDKIEYRGTNATVTRDNVVIELGIAYGTLGKERTFFAQPRKLMHFRAPTNLSGPEPLRYDEDIFQINSSAAVAEIASHFRTLIRKPA